MIEIFKLLWKEFLYIYEEKVYLTSKLLMMPDLCLKYSCCSSILCLNWLPIIFPTLYIQSSGTVYFCKIKHRYILANVIICYVMLKHVFIKHSKTIETYQGIGEWYWVLSLNTTVPTLESKCLSISSMVLCCLIRSMALFGPIPLMESQ